tara:strand:- start:2932 stop:3690 length:759 start_codon:yes stop_codon:yes gene_type:complete
MSLIVFHFSLSLFIVIIIILMSVPSILPNSDAVSFIETNNINFYNLFQLTIDVSNINDISTNNVKYGFSDNNPFSDLNFSQSVTKTGKSGGEVNNYIDQSIKMDIQRHVLFEKYNNVVIDTLPKHSTFLNNVSIIDETIESNIANTINQLISDGPKTLTEISGNSYEYYYRIQKKLLEITLQEQSRLEILQNDISLAQYSNPGAEELNVNLKFLPGDSIMIYVNYNFDLSDVSNIITNNIDNKSYRIVIKMI